MLKILTVNIKRVRENPFVLQNIKTIFLRIFGIILLFGFTLYLTHNYDPKIIGQYDFIRTFLLVVGSICLLGTEQSILYYAGRLKSIDASAGLKTIYKKMIALIFMISLLIVILFFIIDQSIITTYFNDETVYPLLLKASVILFFYSITLLNTEVFRALESIYIAELYRNTFKYASVIIGAILLFKTQHQTYLADTFLFGFVLLAIISTIMVWQLLRKAPEKEIPETFTYTGILKKSYPMAISAMAIFLLMTFDIIFLKKYWGNQTVAFYNVAIKIMTIIAMIINVVNVNVSSRIAECFYGNNTNQLIQTLKQSARLIFILTFPATLIICFYSNYILGFFGNEYVQAQEALIILIAGQGLCAVFGLAPIYLNMTGRQNAFQIILICAVIINFSLNRILIPTYGITGAAIAFSTSMFFWNFTAAVFIYYKDKIKVFLT